MRCGVARYGDVMCGDVWCSVVRYGDVMCGDVWCGVVRYSAMCYDVCVVVAGWWQGSMMLDGVISGDRGAMCCSLVLALIRIT